MSKKLRQEIIDRNFKNKKITQMGLGILGRGIKDAIFLVENGAILTITDLKKEDDLAPALVEIEKIKDVTKLVLGEHKMEDFENVDLILKAAGVPLDSEYILHAEQNNIKVAMDESLFAKIAPGVTIIGVTGTRGKTTVSQLIYHILKEAGFNVFISGNIEGGATLPLLETVPDGSFLVLELSSWQLQGFQYESISPHIAVFTNFLDDHLNYYKGDRDLYMRDKASIFEFQSEKDVLITDKETLQKISDNGYSPRAEIITDDHFEYDCCNLFGEHSKLNVSLAVSVALKLGVSEEQVKKSVDSFKGVSGRLYKLGSYGGYLVYDDSSSSTPDSLCAAISTLGKDGVVIFGGTGKDLDLDKIIETIKEIKPYTILLPGSGSDQIKMEMKVDYEAQNIEDALGHAFLENRGKFLLFSPGFSSFEHYSNTYDRKKVFHDALKRYE